MHFRPHAHVLSSRSAAAFGLLLACALASCTVITDAVVQDVIHCERQSDGARCGNEIDDDIDRICVAGTCVPRGCGDGYLDAGETCDDGNTASGD